MADIEALSRHARWRRVNASLAPVDRGRLVLPATSGSRVGVCELDYQRNLFACPETIYPGFDTAEWHGGKAKGRSILCWRRHAKSA